MENNTDLDKTVVYPFCYKIKETCLPTPTQTGSNQEWATLLGRFLAATNNKEEKEKYYDKLYNFLEKYGDIYKRLNIELYVNPSTKQVLFPNSERIQANFIQYVTNKGVTERHPNFRLLENYKKTKNEYITLYSILMCDKLREIYNEFYILDQLGDRDSIQPKTYGIARLIGESAGGKKSKRQKRQKTKTAKKRKLRN